MSSRPWASRAELHFAPVGFRVGGELFQVGSRQILAGDQDVRTFGNQANRRKVGGCIVKWLFVERLILSVGAGNANDDLIAIRRGPCDAVGSGHTARASDIFNHDLLT